MKPTGEDVASAIREWVKEDIKKSPSSKHDIGKFFLGVSTGGLGLFATLLKFGTTNPVIDCLTLLCFGFFSLSAVIGVYMARPPVVTLTSETDLYAEYDRIVRNTIRLMNTWFVLWLLGFIFGVWKLFNNA